ncbi:hypothetical protein [Nostoc flagelliforme]|nr:hypothetical protein [Nostoc flagelliforme]
MKLPEFSPEPIRDEDQPGYQKEIWQPSWRCFCCRDLGIVDPHLARLVMPTYNSDRDRNPICQAPGCNEGANWLHLKGNIDMRFTAAICQELDRINRENWRQATQQQFERYKNQVDIATGAIAQSHSLAVTNRTSNDDREVAQRKAEIEAISPEQWEAMNKAYLVGSNKDE